MTELMLEVQDDNSPAVNDLIGLDSENRDNEFLLYSTFLCNPHLTLLTNVTGANYSTKR